MDNNQPIGIFDSGIGGTSIWKEIHLLPNEKPYTLQTVRMRLMAKNLKKRL
jgi:glutamate racemase